MEGGGFALLTVGCLALVFLALVLIGRYYPGSGADVLDWKPTRSAELEAELEQHDIEQMLSAQNERRRMRGAPERTLEDLERDVAATQREYRDLQRRLDSDGAEEAGWLES